MQTRHVFVGAIGARRIVRVGDKYDARPLVHQRQKRVDIRAIIAVRCDDHCGCALPGSYIVNGKTIADVNDFIPRPSISHGSQIQKFIGTGATDNAVALKMIMRT
jgi:uncharacterized Zn-binding protein involved in type VI secretion